MLTKKMNKTILIGLLFSLMAAGCGKANTNKQNGTEIEGKTEYAISRGSYSFWYPKDWKLEVNKDTGLYTVSGKNASGKIVKIELSIMQKEPSLLVEEDFKRLLFGQKSSSAADIIQAQSGSTIFKYKVANEKDPFVAYAMAFRGLDYVVATTSNNEDEPVVLEMLQTFKFNR